MKFSEKIIIPLIIISLITALGCYYILEDYNRKQVEIKKGITSTPTDSENSELVVTDDDLKCESIAILIGKDENSNTLTFSSIDSEKTLELAYSSATNFLGKYGKSITLDQLSLGEILDVSYSVHNNTIDKMQVSDKAWSYTDVKKFTINEKARTMAIGDSKYRMESNVIVSYKDSLAKLFDVTSVDTLIVKGIDKKVLSIIVDKGHGYLRLKNETYFQGGWLEVGQEIITTISEGMLLPVPEGEYHIRVSNRGYVGDEDVDINRDKETIVDLSKVDITEVAIGHIEFDITPDFAQLYIDGQMTEFDERVPLEYGIHSMRVEFAGYETVSTNIKVDTEFADIAVSLDKIADNSSSSSDSSTNKSSSSSTVSTSNYLLSTSASTIPVKSSSSGAVWPISSSRSSIWDPWAGYATPTVTVVPTITPYISSSSSTSSSSTSEYSPSSDTNHDTILDKEGGEEIIYNPNDSVIADSSSTDSKSSSSSGGIEEVISQNKKLYIEEPKGAEVYIDGVYVGVIPAACNKPTPGPHIIVIYKNGYVPKSYTVEIADDNSEQTISFSDLIKE